MSNQLSEFGKAARHWRVDNNMTLKQMADVIGVNPVSLSNVETGKRDMPSDWIPKLPPKLALPYLDAEIRKLKDQIGHLELLRSRAVQG